MKYSAEGEVEVLRGAGSSWSQKRTERTDLPQCFFPCGYLTSNKSSYVLNWVQWSLAVPCKENLLS